MRDACRAARINVKVVIILLVVMVLLAGSAAVAYKVRKRLIANAALAEGQAAFEQKDWETARKQLRRYLSKYPDDAEVLEQYAEAELSVRPLEQPNVGGAIGAYRRLIQIKPDDEMPYERLATLYSSLADFAELAYIARKRLDRVPHDPKATLWLATSLLSQHKLEDAQKTLKELVEQLGEQEERHPEFIEACATLSRMAARVESATAWSEALGWLDRSVEYDPQSPSALVTRARFHRLAPADSPEARAENLAKARADLERAAGLEAVDPRVHLLASDEWIQHGDMDHATAELEAVEDVDIAVLKNYFFDPDDWLVLKFDHAARLALWKRDGAEGLELVNRALSPHDPQHATIKYTHHRVMILPAGIGLYLAGGEVERARLCLDELLDATAGMKLAPEREEQISFLKANVAWAQGEPYKVIEVLEPVTASNPALAVAWRQLAEAFARTNQSRRAVQALTEYLNLRPDDSQATLQLARQYIEQGNWARGLEAARLAESLGSTDVAGTLLRLRAGLHVAVEQSDATASAALETLSAELATLRESHPDLVAIRLLQVLIAAQQERMDVAEQELKQAIAECSDTLPAEMQLARLYIVTKRPEQALEVARAACERHVGLADPWMAWSELQRANEQSSEAHQTLQAGLEAMEDPRERSKLTVALALFDILYADNRGSGIDLLKELAVENDRDVRVRSLLLGMPEVQADQAYAKQLIEELKQIEGETTGLMWRLYEAAVWLSQEGWQSKQQEISDLLSYCIAADSQWPAPVLLLGGMCVQLGDSDRAEDLYRSTLRQDAAAVEVADRLLNLLEAQGRFSEARQILSQVEADPQAVVVRRVGIALGAGDYAEAIDALKLRLANQPNDATTLIALARLVYLDGKDVAAAFDYLDQAEALSPDPVALTAARVWILEGENQPNEARELLDELVARENTFRAYLLRAQYFASTGQLDLAEKDYLQLTRLEDNNRGEEFLGQFYMDSGRLAEAIATWEKASQAYPESLSLKRNLMKALLLRAQGDDRQRAEAMLAELGEQLPDNPDLLWVRALLALDEGTEAATNEAQGLLEQVIRRQPTHIDAHLGLIGIAVRREDYTAARDLAIAALGANHSSSRLLLARAEVERVLRNPQVAWELARQVLSDDPEEAGAGSILVVAALETRDFKVLEATRGLLTEALAERPDNEAMQLGLAKILSVLGQTEAAIAKLEGYRQADEPRSTVNVLLTLADLHRVHGDLDISRERIEAAAALAPDSLAVIRSRIKWLAASGQLDQIVTLASDYSAKHPDDTDVLMAAATALASSNQEQHRRKARTLYEHVTTIAPQLLEARLPLAVLAYQDGDVVRAEQGFRDILVADPANAAAANNLAWLLVDARGDDGAALAEALELANIAVNSAPDKVQFLETRGRVLAKFPERLQEARADFEKCVRLARPGSLEQIEAASGLARLCLDLNDIAGASRCDNVGALMVAASVLAASGQEQYRRDARALFEHVASIAPRVTGAHRAIAWLAYEDGDFTRAEQASRAILAVDPANADAANDLAWLLAEKHGDDQTALKEALELANQAVDLAPDNLHFLDTRGVVLSKYPERLSEARADFEKCMRLSQPSSPRRAKAALNLARVCVQLNEAAEARRHLDEAARIDQEHNVFTPEQRDDLRALLEKIGASEAQPVP